jgi:hypothetical protein
MFFFFAALRPLPLPLSQCEKGLERRKAARDFSSERLSGGTVWIDLRAVTFGKKVSQ